MNWIEALRTRTDEEIAKKQQEEQRLYERRESLARLTGLILKVKKELEEETHWSCKFRADDFCLILESNRRKFIGYRGLLCGITIGIKKKGVCWWYWEEDDCGKIRLTKIRYFDPDNISKEYILCWFKKIADCNNENDELTHGGGAI